jgi:hypothetical protein
VYDKLGSRYHRGKGLLLLVDGVVVASSPTLSKLSATIEDAPVSPPLPKPPSATPPPPPPAPPAKPVAGWTELTNLTGVFCCDGLADCSPPLIEDTTEAACMAMGQRKGAE